jgi:hypothetical protein
MCNIAIDGNFGQGCADRMTLNGLALVERNAGGSEGVTDTDKVVLFISCCGIISLYATLQNGASEEFGFLFQNFESCCGFSVSGHHPS